MESIKKENKYIKQMQDIAKLNNGNLISNLWTGTNTRYLFSWHDGREFTITHKSLRINGWPKNLDNFLKFSEIFQSDNSVFFDKLKIFAQENNFELISPKWEGKLHKYIFSHNSQIVTFSYDYILKNRFVKNLDKYIQQSTSLTKTSLEKLNIIKEIAQKNNGKLLDTEWTGDKSKHLFSFEDGSTFEITPYYLKKNGWPINQEDYFKRSLSYKKTNDKLINDLKLLAEKNNGKLIDKEWKGASKKYLFQFEDGRYFEALPGYLINQGWPKNPDSFFKKSNDLNKEPEDLLNELKEIARKNNGKLIDTEWKGSKSKYKFQSTEGLLFNISCKYLYENGWPKNIEEYIYLSNRFTMSDKERIEEINQIAIKNGGSLLTKNWFGTKYEYEFQDQHGLIFYCNAINIINGQWSPDRGLLLEPACRQIIEHLFTNKFVKTRKVLTSNITGRNKALELDGYCKDLNIAFEYQGHPSHWDKNNKNYDYTKEKDELKKEYCEKLGITLIQIEHFEERKFDSNALFKHVLYYIEKTYTNLNLEIPHLNKTNFVLDTSKIHHGLDMLKQMSNLAKFNEATLLSNKWKGSESKYLFKDKNNYEFEITWSYLREIGWPKNPKQYSYRSNLANKTNKERMLELQKIANKNNGKVISDKWLGARKKHCFQFEDGRLFYVSPDYIKDVGWPKNPDNYFSKSNSLTKTGEQHLQKLKEIALKNNGKLISTSWIGSNHKYLFEFKDGRQFSLKASNITKWPKDLDLFLKLSAAHNKTPEERMSELKNIANENNGKVISDKWLGTSKKHILEFSDGRQFKMSLEKLKANGWPKNPDNYLKIIQSRKKIL